MQLLDGAFTALFLLISGASAVAVPPPTNVTVSCQNLRVTASWKYAGQQPETSFRIDVRGAAGHFVKETSDHQYDLSHFIWTSEKHYMDNYYVSIAAVLGGSQSDPVQSKTFTFNNVKTADVTCVLDFPPASLTRTHSGALLSFSNPFHFYKELKQADKRDTAIFSFTPTSDAGMQRFSCSLGEETCKGDITFPDSVAECVTVGGVLFDGSTVGQVLIRETPRICASRPLNVFLLAGLLPVVALIITVVIVIICKVNPCLMNTPVTLPSPLKWSSIGDSVLKIKTVPIERVAIAGPSARTRTNPSVSSDENSAGGIRNQDHSRLLSETSRMDDDNSGKTDCVSVDSEEEEEKEEKSGYDCPRFLPVDMGDGDMAMGYKE